MSADIKLPPVAPGPVLNPHLYPSKGYRFKDAGGVEHVASDLMKLIKNVAKYRVRTGAPLGDPEREIINQICKRQPQICGDYHAAYDGKVLASYVVNNIAQSLARAPEFVDKEISKERAEVCRFCPSNVDWSKGCPPCHKDAAALLRTVLRGVEHIAFLTGRACLIARDDLSLSVHRKSNAGVLSPTGPCWREVGK